MEEIFVDRIKVNSKRIDSMAYDPDSYTLEIEFKNGDIVRYFGVPDYIFETFSNSPVKDQFFSKYIDHAGFSFEFIE
ncbi:KTSC domain-containing protein [candidate division KSB1 bacterium]|nr:KTSC domain-containing protein [candidate division KSB1 bacterium]